MGLVFRTLRTAGLYLGLSLAPLGAAHARAECRIEQVAEAPAKVEGRRLIVEVTIDGKPVEMILDTGAPATLITAKTAERLGLRPHASNASIGLSGVGGVAVVLLADVKELALGRFAMRNGDVFVLSTALDRGGLMGRDMFGNYDVEFDLAHGAIRLLHPIGCTDAQMIYWGGTSYGEAPLRAHSSFVDPFQSEISLNGQPFTATLDTGSPMTLVTTAAARRVGVTLAGSSSRPLADMGGVGPGRVSSFLGLFRSAGVGDEAIANAHLVVADLWKHNTVEETGTRLGAIDVDPTQGLIGIDFFQSNRVLISPSHRKVFFTYLGGPVFHAPENDAHATAPPPLPVPAAADRP